MIYLDNAATTTLHPAVLEAMMPYLTDAYGNPGSLHAMGRQAAEAVDKARRQVADFLHCKPEQVVFTAGGSEGNNLVLKGLSRTLRDLGKTHVVVSKTEHESTYKAALQMCIKDGFHLSFANPTLGEIRAQTVEKLITPHTGLVSVMTVNNEVGTINPVHEIGRVCREKGVFLHTDAVQAAMDLDLDMSQGFCDFLTVSSHKINGPKGMGAVYARDPSLLRPLISGGEEQEFGLRGGTENVAGIVGFGKACELAAENIRDCSRSILWDFCPTFTNTLRMHGVKDYIVHTWPLATSTPKILNIAFPGVDAQTLLLMLDSQGVCVSAGSACQAHEHKTSRVLLAMGIPKEEADSSIRISFSHLNTVEEVHEAAVITAGCVKALRRRT